MSGCCCTTTTVGPNVCPDGYEPCGADSIWSWGLLDPFGQINCSWVLADPCPEGCIGYPPSQAPPPCENGFQVNAPGLCCKPVTTTTCAPNQVIGFRIQDMFNEFGALCKICVPHLCASEEPNLFTTCEQCRDAANAFNITQPICFMYECSPTPPI